jgi:hypothetical protein
MSQARAAIAITVIEDHLRENPQQPRSWVQNTVLGLRIYMAYLTGILNTTFYPRPWGDTIDYAVNNASVASGVILSYASSTAWLDIVERLRLEGRGYAPLGAAAGTARILVASVPVAAIGFAISELVMLNNDPTKRVYPIVNFITKPPLWRMFTAVLSPLVYELTKKLIHRIYPAPNFTFNQRPPLHIVQRLMAIGLRIYDALVIYEMIHIFLKAYGPKVFLENAYAPVIAAGVDQLLVNVIDPIAFRRHNFDGAFPFHRDMRTLPTDPLEMTAIVDDQSNVNTANTDVVEMVAGSTLDNYEFNRGNVYLATHTTQSPDTDALNIRNNTYKRRAWYTGRVAIALILAASINALLSLAQEDKEELPYIQRKLYEAAIVLAAFLGERIFEEMLPKTVQAVGSCVYSCYARFFRADEPARETDPLLTESNVTEEHAVPDDEDDDIIRALRQ